MSPDQIFFVASLIGLCLLLANILWLHSEKISLISLLILALACAVPAYELSNGEGLNAGSFPFTLSVMLLLSLLVSILKSLKLEKQSLEGSKFVLLIILLCAAYLYLANITGYYSATIVFIGLIATLLGNKKHITLGVSIVCWCFFVYFVFQKTLSIPLPKGALF